MGPRLLVCISSAGASVALWRGRLVQARRYELGEEGEAAFAQLLATCESLPARFHRWYGVNRSGFAGGSNP